MDRRQENHSRGRFVVCVVWHCWSHSRANYGEGGDSARQRLLTAIRLRDGVTEERAVALHAAVGENDAVSVRKLVRQGADVSAADEGGLTPLHLAASCGLEQMVLLLLRLGAPVDPVDDNGQTLLHMAILDGHFVLARKLEQKGADPDVEDDNGNKPADLVENPFLSHWCALRGWDIEVPDVATGNTALIESACQSDLRGAKSLIRLGADIGARNSTGSTALAGGVCTRARTTRHRTSTAWSRSERHRSIQVVALHALHLGSTRGHAHSSPRRRTRDAG